MVQTVIFCCLCICADRTTKIGTVDVVSILFAQMSEHTPGLTDRKNPVGDGIEYSMRVVERSEDGLERQTLSFRFVLAIVSRVAALEDGDEEPGSSEKSV
jgi:hypothetical protein